MSSFATEIWLSIFGEKLLEKKNTDLIQITVEFVLCVVKTNMNDVQNIKNIHICFYIQMQ